MAEPRLLTGEVVEPDDPRADIKQRQIEALDRKIREKKAELADMQETARAIAARLHNAYLALQAFFEVHDTPAGVSPAATPANQDSDKWMKLREKLGGKMAEIIEALQLTGVATRTQLRNQTGGALGTIDQAVYKLRDMGLVVKNGDGWSLKL